MLNGTSKDVMLNSQRDWKEEVRRMGIKRENGESEHFLIEEMSNVRNKDRVRDMNCEAD